MNRNSNYDYILHLIFYIVGGIIMINLLFPIINTTIFSLNQPTGQAMHYKLLFNKAIPAIEAIQQSDDMSENNTNALPLLFKYLTKIDIYNPKTYIIAQLPILQFVDLNMELSKEQPSYVEVVPKDKSYDIVALEPNITKNEPITVKENTQPQTKLPEKTNVNPAKPVVLIYHTHARENYNPLNINNYNHSYNFEMNVCKIGTELKKELETRYGISVIHDSTVHDVPTSNGGYTRSRKTVQSYLAKYPSLKLIIDLHRDSANRTVSTAKINNEFYSRIMFVIGSGNKKKAASIAIADKLNKKINELYPGFSRGLYYSGKYAVYNQDLSPNIVLIEVGSNQNSLDESIRTVKPLGRVLFEVLK